MKEQNENSSSSIAFVIATLFTLIGVGLHAYLAGQHLDLLLGGSSGESLCNINQTFNCDTVNASSYSSFAGIPMSIWGLVTNVMFLCLLLYYWVIGRNEAGSKMGQYLQGFALFIALTSVVMGFISLVLIGAYCIFCIAIYVCSFITLFAVKIAIGQPFFAGLFEKPKKLVIFAGSMAGIVLFAGWVTKGMLLQSKGADKLDLVIKESLGQWKASAPSPINIKNALAMGASDGQAKMILIEFADFRCPHCRYAAPTLHAFAKANLDKVRFMFVSFPLDGECNEAVNRKNGLSCLLSKTVYCANLQGKGWEAHDYIFSKQPRYQSLTATKEVIGKMVQKLSLDNVQLDQCVNDSKTHDAIVAHALAGAEAGVRGTPSIFANGRRLPVGQFLPVLQAVLDSL